MRRRHALFMLGILVVFAVFLGIRLRSERGGRSRRTASTESAGDSSQAADSLRNSEQLRDTMCLASRIGIPCNPL